MPVVVRRVSHVFRHNTCAEGTRRKISKFACRYDSQTNRRTGTGCRDRTTKAGCSCYLLLQLALKGCETERAVEISIEFVVFAQRQFHDALQLFDVVDVYDRIDIAEKGGVRIHRAQ